MAGALSLPGAEPATAADRCAKPLARIVSVFGSVDFRGLQTEPWKPAPLNTTLCPSDLLRVGEESRAAIVFLDTDTVFRIDQNTELQLRAPAKPGLSFLRLIKGALHLFSRTPRALTVDTPLVNAAVEGTEFLIRVAGNQVFITVFEGRIVARNPFGTLILTDNQSAVTRRGAAPEARIVVRPRDAVQWTLYYVPVFTDPRDPAVPSVVRRAARLLAAGEVEAARAQLGRTAPSGAVSALRAIIAVAQNRKEDALRFGRDAVSRSPASAAAKIALSYALQANFRLEAARDTLGEAVKQRPKNPLAWARLAELWLMLGHLDQSLDAAAKAAAISPDVSRMNTVLGFASLAQISIDEAKTAFERAINLDSQDPLPRLGLGLAKIRDGDLAEGRREIEIAAALDPGNSIVRSYLGKAYFEESGDIFAKGYFADFFEQRRSAQAAKQLEIAKELDPRDPTPWFYDALRKQAENDPIGALRDVQKSKELNDNRAVYRSSQLLDEDLAARGARLGSIYRDLGFEQLALVEGWKSIAIDPKNHSAHRLLADTYSVLPRHEIAKDSELLQSQLLQPINLNPVQPRLANNGLAFLDTGPADVGFNEFTRLFASNGAQLQADGIVGGNSTHADNVIVSGIYRNVSVSLGQFHADTDGIRQNNDLTQDIYNGFAQVRISNDTSAQIELRKTKERKGDRSIFFFRDNFISSLREDSTDQSVRMGFRHSFTPNSTMIGSYYSRDSQGTLDLGAFKFSLDSDADFLELRHIQKWDYITLTGGMGYFNADVTTQTVVGPFPPSITQAKQIHRNGYLYITSNYPKELSLIVGISGDKFDGTTPDERSQVNPKAGVIWNVLPATTLRAAAFRVLKRTLTSSQTIEPTNVAGFNQFFDDPNGTDSWRYGVAIDQAVDIDAGRIGPELYGGIEISQRDLTFPVVGLGDFDQKEKVVRAYVYYVPFDWLAFSTEYQFERVEHDPAAASSPSAQAESRTHKVPIEMRLFHPSGLFGRVKGTYLEQEGQFQTVSMGPIAPGSDISWVFDALIGFRFPNRIGLATVEVRNLFDEQIMFQDTDPANSAIAHSRLVLVRLTLAL